MSLTPNIGAGACPLGASAYGFGVPAFQTLPTRRVLLTQDGSQGAAASIDTVTGDYILDSDGNKLAMGAAEQAVLLAVKTARGSSAVTSMGVGALPETRDENTGARLKEAYRLAFAGLEAQGLVTLEDVTYAPRSASGANAVVVWRETSTGIVRQTEV